MNVKFACLGDIVGTSLHYKNNESRNADACLNLLQSIDSVITIGNHDLFHLNKTADNSVYKYPKDWYHFSKEEQYKKNRFVWNYKDELTTKLSNKHTQYLNSISEFHIENNMLFSHFLYPDLTGSLAANSEIIKILLPTHFLFMKIHSCFISFVGHLHVDKPFVLTNKGKKEMLINKTTYLSKLEGDLFIVFCPPLVNYGNKRNSGVISYETEDKTLMIIFS
jgi:hypothetical protein